MSNICDWHLYEIFFISIISSVRKRYNENLTKRDLVSMSFGPETFLDDNHYRVTWFLCHPTFSAVSYLLSNRIFLLSLLLIID